MSTSAGQSGNSNSIIVPSGVTKGVLFACGSGWSTQQNVISVSGSGIISKQTLSSQSGNVNSSATSTTYELDFVTLSPGGTITLSIPTQSTATSYPCAYMTLYY